MTVEGVATVVCGKCGRKQSISGQSDRQFVCGCGHVTMLRGTSADNDETDSYDLAEAPFEPGLRPAASGISADVVRDRLGIVPEIKPEEPDPDVEATNRRMDRMLEPCVQRDVVVPLILMAVGIFLSFYEVMNADRRPVPFDAALPQVALRVIMSMVLVTGGIFLATVAFDICIIGSFSRCLLRIAGIAIGPAAVYGILCHLIGDVAGGAAGVLCSVLLYGLLFRVLLQLDWKDTSICVLLTWILITAVNYGAYKFQAAAHGFWV